MARKLRLEFAGALYHVVTRGNRRQAVFEEDADRLLFLQTLGETCVRTRWEVHAYCLMPDHIHLVLATREPNLAAGMKWLLGTYAARTNRRHGVKGHLFSNRYQSLLVEPKPRYLQAAVDYVHLNPARANQIQPDQALSDYPWSSLPAVLSDPRQRPGWLRVDALLGSQEQGPMRDTPSGRRQLSARLESLRLSAEPAEFSSLRHGWCFGSARFRNQALRRVEQRRGRHHYGPELHEASVAGAEDIVKECLKTLRWKERELVRRPKGDANKVRIARRLREESVVTLDWIAQRLRMGTRTYLAHLLYWNKRRGSGRSSQPAPGRRSGGRPRGTRPEGELSGASQNSILLTDPMVRPTQPAPPVSEIGFDPSFD